MKLFQNCSNHICIGIFSYSEIIYNNYCYRLRFTVIVNITATVYHQVLQNIISILQVGIRGKDLIVLGVEKKSVAKLQEERTVRKICLLDDHVVMAFAGLTADARILIDRSRIECQSHKLTVEDPVTLEYITRHIAGLLYSLVLLTNIYEIVKVRRKVVGENSEEKSFL